jgi:hypothetical protein
VASHAIRRFQAYAALNSGSGVIVLFPMRRSRMHHHVC